MHIHITIQYQKYSKIRKNPKHENNLTKQQENQQRGTGRSLFIKCHIRS